MTVLMFRNQWIEPILAGTKVQTIRPKRKRPISVGDLLSLRHWTGSPYRSKQSIIAERRCTSVHSAKIACDYLLVDAMPLSGKGIESFSRRDGFATFFEMTEFFQAMHGLPFEGDVIAWD